VRIVGKIAETRVDCFEMQIHDAGGAVTLLGHDHLGATADGDTALHPFLELLGAVLGLFLSVVIFVAVDKEYDVGILLDGAGFAKIGELGPLVLALLDGT
jgi:hypothetical protein